MIYALLISVWGLAIMGVWMWSLAKRPKLVVLWLGWSVIIAPGVFGFAWVQTSSLSQALGAVAGAFLLIALGLISWWIRYRLPSVLSEQARLEEKRRYRPKELSEL